MIGVSVANAAGELARLFSRRGCDYGTENIKADIAEILQENGIVPAHFGGGPHNVNLAGGEMIDLNKDYLEIVDVLTEAQCNIENEVEASMSIDYVLPEKLKMIIDGHYEKSCSLLKTIFARNVLKAGIRVAEERTALQPTGYDASGNED